MLPVNIIILNAKLNDCKSYNITDTIFYINDSFKWFYIALSGIIFNVHEKNISLIFYGFMTVKNV